VNQLDSTPRVSIHYKYTRTWTLDNTNKWILIIIW
jgi:hypothetical protein